MIRTEKTTDFVEAARAVILAAGGVETPGRMYEFQLTTRCGMLGLSVEENLTEGHGSVMCRFAEPDRAKGQTYQSCNPFTGKWNHHYFDGTDAEAIEDFKTQLATILDHTEEPRR
jgi:hypothetical protein